MIHTARRRAIAGAATLALLAVVARRATAQGREELGDFSATSTIMPRTFAELSLARLHVLPDVEARVVRLPGGGWGLLSPTQPGVVQRFDSSGTRVGTLSGYGQESPVEAGDLFAVRMHGELWILDSRHAELDILGMDLRLEHHQRLNVRPFFVAPGRNGASLLVSGSAHAAGTYYAIARVSRAPGADVFGEPLGTQPLPSRAWLVERRMAAETANGEVWAVAMSGGSVDVLRSTDLSVLSRLQLPGQEMHQKAQWIRSFADSRPAPRLLGVSADSAELLWLTFGVADEAWRPGLNNRGDPKGLFDTRIVVIDAARRAVVGTLQLDPICMPVERNLVSCVDPGTRTLRILALELKRRRPTTP